MNKPELNNHSPIFLTAKALEEIKHIIKNKGIPDGYNLRIGAKGTGCAGISYILGFDKQKPEDDVFEINHLRVLIEKKQTLYLVGLEIDYVDTAEEKGFIFKSKEK